MQDEQGDADAIRRDMTAEPFEVDGPADRLPPLPGHRIARTGPFPPPLDAATGFRGFDPASRDDAPPAAPAMRTADRTPPADRLSAATAAARDTVGTMPSARARTSIGRKIWFGVGLVAPILLGALYLFLIAPDRYVTEYRFSVREPVGQQGAAGSGAMAALFGGNPTPGSDLLDNYTVTDYIRSPQAARDLDRRLGLRRMFSRPADPFARLAPGAPAERLARYWEGMVQSDYDPASGLAVVRVEAFTPRDSYAIAQTLLALSGELVNGIGTRSRQDSVRFARAAVDRASAQVRQLRGELSGLRLRHGTIDPATGVVAGNAALANSLRANLAQMEAQAAALTAQLRDPDAPQVQLLRSQLQATRAQLARADGAVGHVGAGQSSLAATVTRFEDVNARLNDASKVLLDGISNYSQAQASADSQRLYLATYSQPTLPESSTAPQRWVQLLILSLVSAMVWLIGLLIANSVREHAR